jgi:preprotein translocase subunit SecE
MTTQRGTAVKPGGPRFRFIRETIAELRKVVWLSRREVAYLTGLVLLVTIATGLVLGLIDYGFTELINKFFLGG